MLIVRQDRKPSNTLKFILAYQAKVASARGRKRKKLRKPPKQRAPLQAQREYYRAIDVIVTDLRNLTDGAFGRTEVNTLLSTNKALRPDAKRMDDFVDDLGRIISGVKAIFYQKWPDNTIEAMAEKAARNINRFNKAQFSGTMKQVVGVDVTAGDPWLAQELKAFTAVNVSLIKSIPQQHFQKLEQTIIRDVTTGKLADGMIEDIQKISDVSDNKAKLIARDQASKFNGTLTELRQKDVGIEKYIWSTAGDDRVRDEHAEREGETFSWDDPPEDGHPGIPINCRCVAIPIFEPPPDESDNADEPPPPPDEG